MKDGHDRADKLKQKRINELLILKEREAIEEQKRIMKSEKKAKKLENKEYELLKRLKETHKEQKVAIHEVELILKSNTTNTSLIRKGLMAPAYSPTQTMTLGGKES